MVRKINSNQGMEENHFQKAEAIDRQSLSQCSCIFTPPEHYLVVFL